MAFGLCRLFSFSLLCSYARFFRFLISETEIYSILRFFRRFITVVRIIRSLRFRHELVSLLAVATHSPYPWWRRLFVLIFFFLIQMHGTDESLRIYENMRRKVMTSRLRVFSIASRKEKTGSWARRRFCWTRGGGEWVRFTSSSSHRCALLRVEAFAVATSCNWMKKSGSRCVYRAETWIGFRFSRTWDARSAKKSFRKRVQSTMAQKSQTITVEGAERYERCKRSFNISSRRLRRICGSRTMFH